MATIWLSMADRLSLISATKRIRELRNSRNFRESAGNAFYSIAEYLAQPISMLLAAPYLVHKLGLEQYGIWVLVSAILGSVGILSTGFGDATVKYVSTYRGQNNPAGVERTIRATLTINAALGGLFGFLVWNLAPYSVNHIFRIEPVLHAPAILAIRISAAILVIRSIESVFVSTLRAFERYGPPVKLNVFLRSVVVVSAVVLAAMGQSVVGIMWATLFWSALVVLLQVLAARRVVGSFNPLPILSGEAVAEVFSFGCFSWLQALAAVVFGYADRLIVAAMLGASQVAIYALCIQCTQPIHSLGAATFNFVFPHLSSRLESGEIQGPRRVYRSALIANVSLAFALCLPFLLVPKLLLTLWMGSEFAAKSYILLSILAVGFAILAINVVPHYALLALGRVKLIAVLNTGSGIALSLTMVLLIAVLQLPGAALGRLMYSVLLAIPYLVVARKSLEADAVCPAVQTIQA